jgi:Domain of unknown function (DUF3459)
MERAVCTWDGEEGWFTLRRGDITVAVNLSGTDRTLAVCGDVLLATDGAASVDGPSLHLPRHSAAIVRS